MAACDIVFHRLAALEFRQSRWWYAKRSPDAARRFREAVAATVARITAEQERFPLVERDYRRARVARFPFVLIFYRRPRGDIMIVAVAHTSRRPGYWRKRT